MKKPFMIGKLRWQAFYTWCLGAFHIGWDLAQGWSNLFLQGLFGIFLEIQPQSKLMDLPKWFTQYFLGPVVGSIFLLFALPVAIIEGLIFKRPYKSKHDRWVEPFVAKYGVKLLLGSFMLTLLGLLAQSAGYFTVGISNAFFIPLACCYGIVGLIGLCNALFNIYGSMVKLYVYRTENVEWEYNLRGLVKIKLDKEPDVVAALNKEFIYETLHMAQLHDQAYAQLVQETKAPPTEDAIQKLGIFSYYDLQKEQSDFLTKLTKDKHYKNTDQKLAAIETRYQEKYEMFEKKYKAFE